MTTENKNVLSKSAMIIAAIPVLISAILGVIAYPHLPEKVPTHWNFQGQVDGWGSPEQGAFLFPALILVLYVFFIVIPKIDPKRKSYTMMGKAYGAMVIGTLFVLTAFYLVTLGAALGYPLNIPALIQFGAGALFIIIGNYMGKFKHNYFVGVRTPWTLANEEVWRKTHRLAGPLWVLGGLVLIVMSFLPPGILLKIFFGVLAVIVVIPAAYSYLEFRKITKDA